MLLNFVALLLFACKVLLYNNITVNTTVTVTQLTQVTVKVSLSSWQIEIHWVNSEYVWVSWLVMTLYDFI